MTRVHLTGLTIVAIVAASVSVGTQRSSRYAAPRTEHGHPDFQGAWAIAFLTPIERP